MAGFFGSVAVRSWGADVSMKECYPATDPFSDRLARGRGISSLDDLEAAERIPLAERELPESTLVALEQAAWTHASETALEFFLSGKRHHRCFRWRVSELLAAIYRAANLFDALGAKKDDVISLLLPNLPETHFALWSGEAAGIVNPINPLLESRVITGLMRSARTRILVKLGPTPGSDIWEKALRAVEHTPPVEHVVQVDMSPYVRFPASTLLAFRARPARTSLATVPVTSLRAGMAGQPADHLHSRRSIRHHEIASLLHTGGTTGAPRLAQRTHANEVYNAWAGAAINGIDNRFRALCGLPLFHAHAQIILGLAPWISGSSVLLATPSGYRDPHPIDGFWEIVDDHQVNLFSGVPTVFNALLERPGEPATGRVELAFCGAAPLKQATHQRFEARFGIPVLEGYGLTEATCISSANPRFGQRKSGSVGLRLPYQDIEVVRLDNDGNLERFCDDGEVGEIVVDGPNVFAGYVEPAHNRGICAHDPADGRQWLTTGDRGRRDADSYFFIIGRSKDLIIRGGHNIDPGMIEEALARHPAVGSVAAIGRPDPHAGEIPVCYVQLADGRDPGIEALAAHAEAYIAERPAQPRAIRTVEMMPLTAVGKIYKPELRRREIKRAYRDCLTEVDEAGGIDVTVKLRAEDKPLARIRVSNEMKTATRQAIANALEPLSDQLDIVIETNDKQPK